MFSLFSTVILLSLSTLSSEDPAGTDFGVDEEITIAENLDIQTWLSAAHTVETSLYGTWEQADFSRISIQPLPISSNTCLVEVDDRLVPGFVFVAGGMHYLAVGANASESLELQPTVYRYSLGEAGESLEFVQVNSEELSRSFAGLDELNKTLLSQGKMTSADGEALRFHRI